MSAAIQGAESALRTALFSLLQSDPEIVRLFGDPPRLLGKPGQTPSLPYMEIVSHRVTDAGSDAAPALEHTIDLEIASSVDLPYAASEALSLIRRVFDTAQIQPEGSQTALLFPVFSEVLDQDDGRTSRARLRLRAITEPLPESIDIS